LQGIAGIAIHKQVACGRERRGDGEPLTPRDNRCAIDDLGASTRVADTHRSRSGRVDDDVLDDGIGWDGREPCSEHLLVAGGVGRRVEDGHALGLRELDAVEERPVQGVGAAVVRLTAGADRLVEIDDSTDAGDDEAVQVERVGSVAGE